MEAIDNMTVDVLWQPELPRNTAPRPGVGLTADTFPLNYPIVYDVSTVKGKHDFRFIM